MEEDTVPVRFEGELIGWVERFGAWTEGTLTLLEDVLRLQSASDLLEVPIADLRTVQPVSGGFQLRTRDGNVLTVRFDAASVIRWERLLQGAVRRCWERLGRGAVSEFQPRIRAG